MKLMLAAVLIAECLEGLPVTATLGIGLLHCRGGRCAVNGPADTGRTHTFTVEPSVWELDAPAATALREGDQIVSIDGVLITSRDGGRRLANLTAGTPVRLLIRRNGQEIPITLTPVRGCNMPRLTVTEANFRGRPPSPPASGKFDPAPDFGMSVVCGDCGWRITTRGRVWSSSESMRIVSVDEGGPAALGGLRAGDRIVAIDGRSISGTDGGEYLGRVKPGQTVRFAYERDGRVQEAVVTPRERQGGRL